MMPRSLDEARRLKPELAFAIYALEPRGAVTLEILEGDQSFTFVGVTEAEAWAVAFPDEGVLPVTPADDRPRRPVDLSIFD